MDTTCCQTACSFFSDSTGLYFYSAVFQGNMALLALVYVVMSTRIERELRNAEYLSDKVVEQYRRICRSDPIRLVVLSDVKEHILWLRSESPEQQKKRDGDAAVEAASVSLLWPHVVRVESSSRHLAMLQARARQAYLNIALFALFSLAAILLSMFWHTTTSTEIVCYALTMTWQVGIILVLYRLFFRVSASKIEEGE